MSPLVGVCGARVRYGSLSDKQLLLETLDGLDREFGGIGLVTGGCRQGADWWAQGWAESKGRSIMIHFADWKTHGRPAGPRRNGVVAATSDILVAMPADSGRGTQDTMRKFRKLHPAGRLIEL